MTTIDNSPATVNLIFTQGDDWAKTFRVGSRPDPESAVEYWDLTDWVGASQIRKKATSTTTLATLTVELGDQSDPDTVGSFTVTLSALASAGLPSACVWDLQLTDPNGIKRTYFAGSVTASREVTR
jgi:hypothetical protein